MVSVAEADAPEAIESRVAAKRLRASVTTLKTLRFPRKWVFVDGTQEFDSNAGKRVKIIPVVGNLSKLK